MIGKCYLELNEIENACHEWNKAKEYYLPEIDSLIEKNCSKDL